MNKKSLIFCLIRANGWRCFGMKECFKSQIVFSGFPGIIFLIRHIFVLWFFFLLIKSFVNKQKSLAHFYSLLWLKMNI